MNFQKRIENLVSGKQKSPEQVFNNINFICTYEFHWSYEQLMKSPIPYVLDMVDKWDKMKLEEQKAAKRRR